MILAKMEEIKTLTSKIGVLKNEHEALEGTAALLRDELEAKEMAVLALEKKLLTADVSSVLLKRTENVRW